MMRRFLTWAGGGYLASSIGCGVTLSCLGALAGRGDYRPTLLGVALLPLSGLLSSIHEAMESLRTLPLFLAALLLWIASTPPTCR